MITVTSAEKKKIEGQMKTALPFINNQVDFNIDLVDGKKGRSILAFKKDGEVYNLPIYYITPSTDDSAWEILTDQIEEASDCDGVFFVKFNTNHHVIHNAVTYALTNQDLYQKKMLAEMSRLCSYVDLKSYQIQLFELTDVNKLFDKLSNQEIAEEAVETVETVEEVEPSVVEETVEVKEEPKTVKVEPKQEKSVSPQVLEDDAKLDSDIRALINDCFGIF